MLGSNARVLLVRPCEESKADLLSSSYLPGWQKHFQPKLLNVASSNYVYLDLISFYCKMLIMDCSLPFWVFNIYLESHVTTDPRWELLPSVPFPFSLTWSYCSSDSTAERLYDVQVEILIEAPNWTEGSFHIVTVGCAFSYCTSL